jgi:uncharacterized protein YggE
MTKPIVRIKTGSGIDEFIDREMNDTEFAQYQIDQTEELAKQAELQAEAEAKAQAKVALLTQLGITAEQAKLLLS